MMATLRSTGFTLTWLGLIVMLNSSPCLGNMSSAFQSGIDLYTAGDYAAAAQTFRQVAVGDPALATKAQYRVGMCLLMQRMLDDAIPAFARALTMASPTDGGLIDDIRLGLAQAYLCAGFEDKASTLVHDLSLHAPETAALLLIEHCIRHGEHERAAAGLIWAFARTPGIDHIGSSPLPAWLGTDDGRASVRAYVNAFCDAVAAGSSLQVVSGKDGDLSLMLELSNHSAGAAAVVRSTFAPEDTPVTHAQKVCALAAVLYRGEDYSGVVQVLQELLRTASRLPTSSHIEATYRLGLSYHKLGDVKAAKKCLQEIIDEHGYSPYAARAQRDLNDWTATGRTQR